MWLFLLMGRAAVNRLAEVGGNKGNCSHLNSWTKTPNVTFPEVRVLSTTERLFFPHAEIWELLICFQDPRPLGKTALLPLFRPVSRAHPAHTAWRHVLLCELGHCWGHSSWKLFKVCGGAFTDSRHKFKRMWFLRKSTFIQLISFSVGFVVLAVSADVWAAD